MPQAPRILPGKPAPPKQGLDHFDIEVSYGGYWLSLNDGLNYKVSAESLQQTQNSFRRVEADNPVVEGKYLVHAIPDHVQETLSVYLYGRDMVDVMEKVNTLAAVFTQFDYQVRVTMDQSREYWRCQTADYSVNRTNTFVHNGMAQMTFQVPRFPTPYYEALV